VLDYIFRARNNKTSDGCSNCQAPYHFFKKVTGKYAYKCPCNKSKLIFPLKGTPLEHSKKPLTLFIEIIYELFCSKHGLTATEVDRRFRIGKNETSHLLLDKTSQWLGLAISGQEFKADSIIEVDEVYPRVQTGLGPYYSFKRGLGSERLKPTITLTERNSDGSGLTKLIAVDEVNSVTLKEIFRKHTKPTNIIYTDESNIYNFLKFNEEFKGYHHEQCNHKRGDWAIGQCHVNTCEGVHSYVKKYIHNVHLGVTEEKIQLYLNRVAFNFSYRDKNFLDALDVLFNSLPSLHENIDNRVQCNRTAKKWEKAA
jgi:transposase-like protein